MKNYRGMTQDIAKRKQEIRKRLRLAKFPCRSDAEFSDENDHNPMVLQDCPTCRGTGENCEHFLDHGGEGYTLGTCPDCGGLGVIGEIERYFKEDCQQIDIFVDSNGWLKCPKCGIRFTIRDRHRWSGRRHLTCGQKLRIKKVE